MSEHRLRVGIIGLQPGQSWAARAHIPALRALPDRFDIAGVANRSRSSAEEAGKAYNLHAFSSVDELVNSPDVDIVTVTVRVPNHKEVVRKAIEAGKSIYCEWPLGRDLSEAEELAAMAAEHQIKTVIGTQARLAPEMLYLRGLMDQEYLGEILSSAVLAYGRGWGATISDEKRESYLLDKTNGATMLSIPMGHTLAAMQDIIGGIKQVSSIIGNRRNTVLSLQDGKSIAMTAPDQVLVNGVTEKNILFSLHYRGGTAPDGHGLIWELNGTKGVIRITGPSGHTQMVPLQIECCLLGDTAFKPVPVPETFLQGCPADVIPGNVARIYSRLASDLQTGRHTAPDFGDAVRLHRLLTAIEQSSGCGTRITV
ncbi:Gfo/Idh/MocA family protein [Sodalis sp. RH15]|uniref:Gfo/Idh/MocA family protein n=1 Tax=Sodalis sp. RH15 TaxID=3394330 RepID=UPI0039B699C8